MAISLELTGAFYLYVLSKQITDFLYALMFWYVSFLKTPCLAVAVHSRME